MGKITLYGMDPSPPVRACLLTLKALAVPFDYKVVNLMTQENRSKEYLEKNPQHTVPTLDDDGHYIWDSHAIMAYLVSKYGKDDSLYPEDLLKRAHVDQRLHFESGVIYQGALRPITAPLLFQNVTDVAQHKIDAVVETYNFLERFLKGNLYVAGDALTIADFSIVSTVSTLVGVVPIEAFEYPKLSAWMRRIEQLPYYEEANGRGANMLVALIKSKNITIVH